MDHLILYKTIEMKADESGIIEGYFSTYDNEPDSYGDIIEPGAFTKTIAKRKETGHPFPLCFNHDFDKVIGAVLEWAEKDGHTLVVVTADHNTGGLTLLKGSIEDREVKVHFSTKGHDGIVVPVFAYGPGAEAFAGVHDNADIGQSVRTLLK